MNHNEQKKAMDLISILSDYYNQANLENTKIDWPYCHLSKHKDYHIIIEL